MSIKTIPIAAIILVMILSCSKERLINEPGNLVPRTADENSGIPSITVNGARLHAEAFGHPDSTMVVFLHGGPGGDYRSLLNGREMAAHGFRVIFYDQRGSGLSQRFPEKTFTSQGAGVLDQFYQELKGVITYYRTSPSQRVYLVGHSWGGILATGFAGKYPAAVQGLVVAEPGGLKWHDIKSYVKSSRQFKLWSELLNDATFLDEFISGREDQHAILDYKAAMVASKNDIAGEDNTAPNSFWRNGAVVNTALFKVGDKHQVDFSAGIHQFSKPVLFLYSAANKAYPQNWALRVSAAYTTPILSRVNGTGHAGIFSDNIAWNADTKPAILDYFDTL